MLTRGYISKTSKRRWEDEVQNALVKRKKPLTEGLPGVRYEYQHDDSDDEDDRSLDSDKTNDRAE